MQWTAEKPTKPGYYWRTPPAGSTDPTPYFVHLSGLRDVEGFNSGGFWAGPVEPPPPPRPKPTMFFTKPWQVDHVWYFQRFEDRKPETEGLYGPFRSEEYAEKVLAHEIERRAETHECVRSTQTLAPDPTRL